MALPKLDSFQELVVDLYLQRCEKILIRNLSECIRCGACERACESRHAKGRLKGQWDGGGAFELAPVCRNCATPGCVSVCPRQAIAKKEDRIVVDMDRCIGCGLCAKACVFSAISIEIVTETSSFDRSSERRTKCAVKCDRCQGLRYQGCVRECPTGALRFLPFKRVLRRLLTGPMASVIKSPVEVVKYPVD